MALLPHFTFPPSRNEESAILNSPATSTITEKRQQPPLHLRTELESREGYKLAVLGRRHQRAVTVRPPSTPPASPTRVRSWTMGAPGLPNMHNNGEITPPITPSGASHSKTNSASSDYLNSLFSLRRGDSMSSLSRPRLSLDESPRPGSTELVAFPHQVTDYEFRTDERGRKKTIGEGAWSDVYLATSCSPKPTEQASLQPPYSAEMTPPLTPVRSVDSGIGLNKHSVTPPIYAIKVPAMTSAKKVLAAEARILSYLSRYPDAENHIVSFYGLDTRSGALVLKAMDDTLEGWIQKELNILDDTSRAQKLAAVFPSIAVALIASLQWMQDKDCTHADIKPSNILVSTPSLTSAPMPVYTDFSSTMLTRPDTTIESEASPLGAGTWDYLDPSLLSSSSITSPSASTDLWSLAITLLFLVLGSSPYDAFKGNKFQQREMTKSGSPLQCMGYDDQGIQNVKRLQTLSKNLGFDVQKWLAKVLIKDPSKRGTIAEWREELEMATKSVAAKM